MPDQFFSQFPLITYANTECRDLTKRVRINASIKDNIDLNYPVEIEAGFRPDLLAEAYYDDEELDWLIYLMNETVDPYYEWYISDIDFNDFIITKYGSHANSQEQIAYYRNNWYEDDNQLTPEQYNSVIDMAWRKYYEPIFTPTNAIYSYRRKRDDWVVNTNRILQYNVFNSEVGFTNSEIVDIKLPNTEIVGGGTVVTSNDTVLIIHHVSGNTTANTTATKVIVGETSGANAFTNAVTTLSENFTIEEGRFWSNVTYYDLELENWESKKAVEVINSDLVPQVTEEVYFKLKET